MLELLQFNSDLFALVLVSIVVVAISVENKVGEHQQAQHFHKQGFKLHLIK